MATVLNELELNEKLRIARFDRYAMQSVARKALPDERVSKCLRLVNNRSQVEVWKHLETEKAFYNGLLVCGSVWHCPICASKISEKRKKELKQAFDQHKKEGGLIALLTLTFSHKINDRLIDTLKKFTNATAKFRSGKRYQKIRDKMNMIGSVRDFEVTYGVNGWHPHIHLALFYFNDVDLKEIEGEMFELWSNACEKFGLTTKEKYGLDLANGDNLNDYLTKHGNWSLEAEMSKRHTKVAKKGSFTPFDFLREYLQTNEEKYLFLFKEYAQAFKGKRQLQWSKDLKKRFLIEDKTDEAVAKEKTEKADLLGLIPYEDWKVILKWEKRAKFLDYVETMGFETAYKSFMLKFKENKKKNPHTKDS